MGAITDFFKALAGISETKALDTTAWSKEGSEVKIMLNKFSDLDEPWSAVYLKGEGLEKPVLVVKDDQGQFHCFSNKCTHMGRKLDPVPGEKTLRCCSVNHSTFDYSGAKLTGPAKGPVEKYECFQDNDLLTIKL
jgi:nitrite reductase/ring-hydroxylating ferredoxin subunit